VIPVVKAGMTDRTDVGDPFEEFSRRIEEYRALGVNPFSLATGCSVKVDVLTVLYPAIRSVRGELEGLGMEIAPRRDADVFPRTDGGFSTARGIYRSEGDVEADSGALAEFSPSRAIVLAQVHRALAEDPGALAEYVGRIYSRVARAAPGVVVGKGHSIVTEGLEHQFMLFDYVKAEGGPSGGYVVGNNDTIQVIDPAEDPGSPGQAAAALFNSLNDLYTLGAWRELRVIPTVDAPTDELRDRILRNLGELSEGLGARVMDSPQPSSGALLMGATVFAETDREPPTFYDRVAPGMEVMSTRPMGDLAPVNVYMMCMLDREIADELRSQTGIGLDGLLEIKERTLKGMATPNLAVARALEDFLPAFGEDFDPRRHVAVTTDVSGPGIYVVRELAELARASIRLDRVPLLSPELSEFATANYIMPNATAGTNGAIVVVADPAVLDGLESELRGAGMDPVRIGRVVSRDGPGVLAPSTLGKYVAAKAYLREFDLYDA